jgi:adenylosuccinate synthase
VDAAERWPTLALTARDLAGAGLAEKAVAGQSVLRAALAEAGVALGEEDAWFEQALAARWAARARWLAGRVVDDAAAVVRRGPVVFEGAQGVLLDATFGFAPHTTRTRCDFSTAETAAARWGLPVTRIGVVRAHAVRHGAGPLPSHDVTVRPRDDHNTHNTWQGEVRYGAFDHVLARYAAEVVGLLGRGGEAPPQRPPSLDGIVLTHLDTWSPRRCIAYTIDGARVDHLPVTPHPTRDAQAALGRRLARAVPVITEARDRARWIAAVEATFGAPVVGRADGPSAPRLA